MTDQTPPTAVPAYIGPRRILSGIQASGALHLGNYLGALKRFTALQDTGAPVFVFVADMHAITVWQDPQKLADQTREIAAAYLASGLDPAKSIIFPQSAVRAHADLAWVFNCVARLGWLDRMTQFKEKSGKHKERASVGLYTYPVLQAADILLYRAGLVPVGADQLPHIEFARDVARRFNHLYGREDDFESKAEAAIRKLAAAIPAAAGMVRIQATTMLPATPQRTAEVRRAAPTPMIAPVMVWVVETGMPSCAAVTRMVADAVSAANPSIGCSLTSLWPSSSSRASRQVRTASSAV